MTVLQDCYISSYLHTFPTCHEKWREIGTHWSCQFPWRLRNDLLLGIHAALLQGCHVVCVSDTSRDECIDKSRSDRLMCISFTRFSSDPSSSSASQSVVKFHDGQQSMRKLCWWCCWHCVCCIRSGLGDCSAGACTSHCGSGRLGNHWRSYCNIAIRRLSGEQGFVQMQRSRSSRTTWERD